MQQRVGGSGLSMKMPDGANQSIGDQNGVQLSSRLNNDSNELQTVAINE